MKNRYLLLAAILLPAAAACSSDGTASSPAASTPVATAAPTASTVAATAAPTADTTPTPAPGAASANEATVGIADFTFTPATVNIPVGGSVVWTNNDKQQHTATSAGNFDAGAIQPGTSTTVTFDTAGSFTYICSFHPFMTGTVVIG